MCINLFGLKLCITRAPRADIGKTWHLGVEGHSPEEWYQEAREKAVRLQA